TSGGDLLSDGEPEAARAEGARPPLRPNRQRHAQSAADRPPAPHQQGARPPDTEPRPGKAPRLRRARRLGAEPAPGLSDDLLAPGEAPEGGLQETAPPGPRSSLRTNRTRTPPRVRMITIAGSLKRPRTVGPR